MNRKLVTAAASVAVVAAIGSVASATATGPAKSAALVIRHQLRGCHSWSVNGGPYLPSQVVRLARGGSLTVTNNDLMPHRLVETSGPAAKLQTARTPPMGDMPGTTGVKDAHQPGMMGHMSATVRVTFPTSGAYRFTTQAGEDYISGVKTIGKDNVLRLMVLVS